MSLRLCMFYSFHMAYHLLLTLWVEGRSCIALKILLMPLDGDEGR